MSTVDISINEAGFREMFEKPDGPLGRYIDKRGRNLMIRVLIRTGSGRPGPEIRTGDMLRRTTYQPPVNEPDGALQAVIDSPSRHNGVLYPRLLELGGTAPNGTPYRYPFLIPAMDDEFGRGAS